MGTTSAMEGGERRGEEGRSRVEGFSEHRRHGRCSSNRTAQALIRFRSQRCRPNQSHTKVKGPKEISDRGEGRTCADQSNRSPRRSPRLRRDLSIGGERRRGGEAKGRRGFKDGNSRIAEGGGDKDERGSPASISAEPPNGEERLVIGRQERTPQMLTSRAGHRVE
ncbi:hypothetical protein BHE74_00034752 [Ensete ventricosum]|nr:hypothetical protein GW17_00012996 [Ensete ventricosum]RWW58389.1 hypothetical protein BHE74_00034752 [Ensete ventricosum]